MGIPIFRESTDHTVYKNSKGEVVPSVTTIIKIINKPELIHWANYLGYKRKSVNSELEIAAFIGETVHKIIEKFFDTGQYSIEDMNKRGPIERISIKNAFVSFLKFYKEEKDNIEVLKMEEELHGEKCGGTMDLLAKYNDKLTICDYKTSKAFYPTMFLQMAGYDILLKELFDIEVDQYMVILLDKKSANKAKLKICDDSEEMQFYKKCFKRLLDFYYDWYYINQNFWNKNID